MSLIIDIEKKYKNFSLCIKIDTRGRATGFLGASGCGKSLTLKCIAGIETPDRGRIILNDRVLYDSKRGINLKPQKRCIGYMFQNYALFPNMTVRENIELAAKDKKNKKAAADSLLSLLRLTGLQNRYPHQLSGGEQQRAALARMMVFEPEVMMFDEPFSALDSYLRDQLQQELSEVLKEYRGEILMVSHSRDELYRFCKSIIVISRGREVEAGDKEEVFGNPSDVATAKLTGCKNISRAVRISDHEVEATDWNIRLQTERPVEPDVRFVGIRAHNIRACKEAEALNSLPVTLAGFSEGPFENSLIMNCSPKGRLWWILSKQEWREKLNERPPARIVLPAERLLLLKDKSGDKK